MALVALVVAGLREAPRVALGILAIYFLALSFIFFGASGTD